MRDLATMYPPNPPRADVIAQIAGRGAMRSAAPPRVVAPSSDPAVSNGDAQATEIYVDWSSHPVAVALGRPLSSEETWEVAGSELRRRALAALAPKSVQGWSLDGTFTAAVTWNRESERGRDLYFGCWMRLRRPEGHHDGIENH